MAQKKSKMDNFQSILIWKNRNKHPIPSERSKGPVKERYDVLNPSRWVIQVLLFVTSTAFFTPPFRKQHWPKVWTMQHGSKERFREGGWRTQRLASSHTRQRSGTGRWIQSPRSTTGTYWFTQQSAFHHLRVLNPGRIGGPRFRMEWESYTVFLPYTR